MNTILVVLVCIGRYCSNEPIYVVPYKTETECIQAKIQMKDDLRKTAYCVPELKK